MCLPFLLREIDKKILFESMGEAFSKLGHYFYFPILDGQFQTVTINTQVLLCSTNSKLQSVFKMFAVKLYAIGIICLSKMLKYLHDNHCISIHIVSKLGCGSLHR